MHRRCLSFAPLLLLLLLLPCLHAQAVFEDSTSSFYVTLPRGTTSGLDIQLTHPTGYSTVTPGSFHFTLSRNGADMQDDVTLSLPDGVTLTSSTTPPPVTPH